MPALSMRRFARARCSGATTRASANSRKRSVRRYSAVVFARSSNRLAISASSSASAPAASSRKSFRRSSTVTGACSRGRPATRASTRAAPRRNANGSRPNCNRCRTSVRIVMLLQPPGAAAAGRRRSVVPFLPPVHARASLRREVEDLLALDSGTGTSVQIYYADANLYYLPLDIYIGYDRRWRQAATRKYSRTIAAAGIRPRADDAGRVQEIHCIASCLAQRRAHIGAARDGAIGAERDESADDHGRRHGLLAASVRVEVHEPAGLAGCGYHARRSA